MKNYRPSTKTVVVGLALMVVGILCWGIMAPLKENPHFFFLFPLGLLLLCLGGLELTITALVTMHKNDLAFRQNEKAKKAAEEKIKTK